MKKLILELILFSSVVAFKEVDYCPPGLKPYSGHSLKPSSIQLSVTGLWTWRDKGIPFLLDINKELSLYRLSTFLFFTISIDLEYTTEFETLLHQLRIVKRKEWKDDAQKVTFVIISSYFLIDLAFF